MTRPLLTTVAMDPPWEESGGGKIKRGADRHYPVLNKFQILQVIAEEPRFRPNLDSCSLWLWTTRNFREDAHWLINQLGATYVTDWCWVKGHLFRNNTIFLGRAGLGQRSRSRHEHLLYARWGSVPVPEPKDRSDSLIIAPAREHSRKPDEAYRVIEKHDPPGRRLELFARGRRKGWASHGNELKRRAA